MNRVVVDASLAGAWMLPDERSPAADRLQCPLHTADAAPARAAAALNLAPPRALET